VKLTFSPLAALGLEEIGDFIALDNPIRTVTFVAELELQCGKILETPFIYRLRPELAKDLRSCAYGNYVIFLRTLSEELRIERIVQGARDLSPLFRSDS
jgi:toxin ParE1/3/4